MLKNNVMIRIFTGIIMGSILWTVAILYNPFNNFDPTKVSNFIDLITPIVYWIVISCGVGLISAVVAGKQRIIAAVLSVLLPSGIIILIIFVVTPKEIMKETIIYGGSLMIICILFSIVGGILSKLFKKQQQSLGEQNHI